VGGGTVVTRHRKLGWHRIIMPTGPDGGPGHCHRYGTLLAFPSVRGSLPYGLTLADWDLGGERSAWAYRHAGELFPQVEIPTARLAAPLPSSRNDDVAGFEVAPGVSLDEYLGTAPVSGIVVVHGGHIAYERYPGMLPDDRHVLMSVTKVFPAILVGMLEERGLLDLSAPVDSVIGDLAAGGWAGVPVDDVLHMRSGIDCPETGSPGAYTDPAHPFYRFEASLGWRPAREPLPSTYDLVAALPRCRPPGETYEYTSVNTFVLSWLVERVTGRRFDQVLGDEIWSRAGFGAPAQLCTSPTGVPVSHGGLSITLRDLARFGMLFTPSSNLVTDEVVIGAEHLRRIQTGGRSPPGPGPDDLPEPAIAAYGHRLPPASRQWNFAMADGDLFKGGFGGQGLYVSPARDLVIAFAGAPRADGSVNLLRWYSRRIAVSLFPLR
jgi:CubicO group peptidase (beta-lactamase class C family)